MHVEEEEAAGAAARAVRDSRLPCCEASSGSSTSRGESSGGQRGGVEGRCTREAEAHGTSEGVRGSARSRPRHSPARAQRRRRSGPEGRDPLPHVASSLEGGPPSEACGCAAGESQRCHAPSDMEGMRHPCRSERVGG